VSKLLAEFPGLDHKLSVSTSEKAVEIIIWETPKKGFSNRLDPDVALALAATLTAAAGAVHRRGTMYVPQEVRQTTPYGAVVQVAASVADPAPNEEQPLLPEIEVRCVHCGAAFKTRVASALICPDCTPF
jgi:hypothetical protein